MQNRQKKYALISVSDKKGITDFAQQLIDLGFTIISTGGTAKTLTENNIPVTPVEKITGNPESFDGRMKTISFQIESGILYDRTNKKHVKEAKDLRITPIDIVVCNLYPFEATVSQKGVTLDTAVENIDVGGPTMVRSAAKNFKNVMVLTDPKDYNLAIEYLTSSLSKSKRVEIHKYLAAKAFRHLSFYDSQIAYFLGNNSFPDEITLAGRKVSDLRYGENPHQKSALYIHPNSNSPLASLQKLWGRDLSLTNVSDINAGLESVRLFNTPAAVIIKHNSPCGIALGDTPSLALKRAIAADPESAFGGVIVLNTKIDMATAEEIATFKDERKGNIDILAGPGIEKKALDFLQNVRKSMGIYTFGPIPKSKNYPLNLKWIDGGFMLQDGDDDIESSFKDWKIVTKMRPTKKQLQQMQIAWKFISKIKSNSVIIVDKTLPMTRGIGSGQTSRIRSTKIAFEQAGDHAVGAILASDSFFPFEDSVKLAAQHKIGVIVQQGGSINDKASIDEADKAGIPMVVTNRRAFWH
jgi:phosphoribosylaminoimidazolecarboxamide formyltransferase / IMP cyclohydrolase